MRKISGLVLDVYDDIEGHVTRSIFPTYASIPPLVKTARAISPEEQGSLPDDVFALVLLDNGVGLRKFACTDAGNTALSVLFFIKNAHKLPDQARVTAAQNLKTACGWYGLDIPEELEKEASGLGKAMFALQLPGTVNNTKQNIKSNLSGIRQAEAGGTTVANLHQMKGKMAEVSGTVDMPQSNPNPAQKKSFPVKTAAEDFGPEESEKYNGGTPGKQPKRNPQAKLLHPFVDVSGKDSTKTASRTSERHALGNKYPIDDYGQVKTAAEYFTKYTKWFTPEERREYCVNLTKRASELQISLPEEIRRYGGDSYADDETMKVAHTARLNLLLEDGEKKVLNALFEKRASIDPELYAISLAEFDKATGLSLYYDQHVFDPYLSTFEKIAEEDDWSEVLGNDLVTSHMLKEISKTNFPLLKKMFGEEMAVEFRKDPIGIFKSLPVDQKKIVARMAGDTSPLEFSV